MIVQTNDEHVINRFGFGECPSAARMTPLSSAKFAAIPLAPLAAAGVQLIQHLQLFPPDRRLNFVKPKVESDLLMKIFVFAAVVAEHGDLAGRFWIVGEDRAAVAVNGQVF